jgi:hypothetical protein
MNIPNVLGMVNNYMQSERTIFSLNGTNVAVPNRYKIHKHKLGKMKS